MNHGLRFTAEKISKRISLIRPLVHRARLLLPEFNYEQLNRASDKPGSGIDHGTIAWDSYWAGQDTHFVLTSQFFVPNDFHNPALYLPLGIAGDIFTHPEALLHIDGRPVASADRHHQLITVDHALADDRSHELMLHGWTGLTGWPPDPRNPTRIQIRPCYVVDIDQRLQEFVTLAEVALDVALAETTHERLQDRFLQALDTAFLALDTRDPLREDFRASIEHALCRLKEAISEIGAPSPEKLHAIGHAHMDIAYLWPIEQIRQKNARTSSNVLRLMNQDPNFYFSHTQPQLYEYISSDFPEIFAAIQSRVSEGRWEVMGGMWVESDCNIPNGESLVRQILLGRSYFKQEFGNVETPVLWLPDTFGFPWSLPQLMKLSGLKYFVTNKLNWNQYNRMPSSSIWWQGIDGSRVLAQFLTTPREVQHLPFPTNYKSDLSAKEVVGTVVNSTSGPDVNDFLIAYGYGDGGGGPTEDLIRKARAFEAMPAAPKVKMGRVDAALAAITEAAGRLPVWNDEMYLEGHRGTLTSQAWIKRANRKAERAMHDLEATMVIAWPAGAVDNVRSRLRDMWKRVCLNQFHDILTGTSVPIVFEDARADYAWLDKETNSLFELAIEAISLGPGLSILNASPVQSAPVVFVPGDFKGQPVEGGTLVSIDPVPPYYTTACVANEGPPVPSKLQQVGSDFVLENGVIRAVVDPFGQLKSLIHLGTGRETLAPGQAGNQLWAFEDRPISWDAWDIDVFHEDRADIINDHAELQVLEKGPLRATLRIVRNYRGSRILQDIRLEAGSPRLDFVNEIFWAEQHTLLKVAFPVAVHNTRASYEIQWGEIERPTHRNTTWDYARFEVPAQRWADLSEGGFGVAVLNDCKYGYDIRENVIRLTLIKSSTSPDPNADQGRHNFVYSILPHEGDMALVRTEARRLNNPPLIVNSSLADRNLVLCEAENVILETLKPAEDGNGYVVRLYEADRRRGDISLSFPQGIARVYICDLLEEEVAQLEVVSDSVVVSLKPFEILSLRCIP